MKFERIHLFNLVAFLGVLIAIVLLALLGEDTDIAILTGLVGVLGSFKPWGSAPYDGPAGTKEDPIAVQGGKEGSKPVPVDDAP